MPEEIKIHVFLSNEAAYTYSKKYGYTTQSVPDILEEIASTYGIELVDERESIRFFINAGAELDDIESIRCVLGFLKNVDREREIHRIPSDLYYQKRIERISSVIVNYYSKITEVGKSEINDIPDFISLFGVKFNRVKYVVHIPSFYKRYQRLFEGSEFFQHINRNINVKKIKFPDYWAEARWIASNVLESEGLIGIIVPDNQSLKNISDELTLLGVKNSVFSDFRYFSEKSSYISLLKSMILAINEDYSFERMMSIITNPILNISEDKIIKIRKMCYDNNITSGWNNWSIVLDSLPELKEMLTGLSIAYGNKGKMIETFKNISSHFPPDVSIKINDLLDLLSLLDERVFKDINRLIYYIDVASSFIKSKVLVDSDVIIGKPEDMLGIEFDKVYIARLDISSSLRSFPEDGRQLIIKMVGMDIYEEFLSQSYKYILESSKEAVLSYSMLDQDLNYTESVNFYDSINAQEIEMRRDEIFIPMDSSMVIQNSHVNKYILEDKLISQFISNPVSPTALETYLDCHFKYFVQHALNLQEIEEPSEFIDARVAGSLTHKILQDNYSTDISPSDFIKKANHFINQEIRKTIFQSKKRALEYYREKFISNGKLGKFFLLDVRNALERGRKLLAKELLFGNDKNVYYDLDGKKIPIKGFVDRVDESQSGLAILDYKSSLNDYPSGNLCNERKVQLYFYKIGVEHTYNKKVVSAAYVSFKDTAEGYQTKGLYEGIQNEEAEIRNCMNIVNPALSYLLNGDFDPYIKEDRDIVKCERTFYCPFLNICRGQDRRW